LVVDDDAFALDFFTTALSVHGYDAIPASGPRQALEIVTSQPPIDVVLSDMELPDMRGPALVSEIARLSPHAACLLMTTGNFDPSELRPAVPLLHKPFHLCELIAAVEDAIA
jgi:CheY-like chemotaxis protein